MAEKKTDSEQDAGADERLRRVQEALTENEALRKRLRLYSACGVFCILFLLTLFFFRLYDYARHYDATALGKNLMKESEPILSTEGKLLLSEVQEGVVADFTDKVLAGLRQEMPKIEAEAAEMGGRLYEHSQKHVEERLVETLAASFDASSEDLRKVFPGFSSVELEHRLKDTHGFFIEHLTDVVEHRLAKVNASIDGLKSAAKRVAESPGTEHFDKTRLGDVEDELIGALLDLVVYEIKPELGRELAETEGGAK